MAAALCALAMAVNARGDREEPVTYQDGTTAMKGFVVYDDAIQGKRPGIVMMHEWWGIPEPHPQRSTQIRATGLHHSLPTCTSTPRLPTTEGRQRAVGLRNE